MKKLYKNILDNIQSIIKSEKNWIEEEFYRKVVRNTFIINMGYECDNLFKKEWSNAFQKKDLLILGSIKNR